jgi:hypothetical protein
VASVGGKCGVVGMCSLSDPNKVRSRWSEFAIVLVGNNNDGHQIVEEHQIFEEHQQQG